MSSSHSHSGSRRPFPNQAIAGVKYQVQSNRNIIEALATKISNGLGGFWIEVTVTAPTLSEAQDL